MKLDHFLLNTDVEMYNRVYLKILEATPSDTSFATFMAASLLRLQSGVNVFHGNPKRDQQVLQFIPNYQYYIFLGSFQTIRYTSQNFNYKKFVDYSDEVYKYISKLAPSPSTFLRFHLNYKEDRTRFDRDKYLQLLLTQNSKIKPRKIGELLSYKYNSLKIIFSTPIIKFAGLIQGKPNKNFHLDDLTIASQTKIVNESNFMLSQFSSQTFNRSFKPVG